MAGMHAADQQQHIHMEIRFMKLAIISLYVR